jgi:ribonucleoside-diphosphate reductase alpha chain
LNNPEYRGKPDRVIPRHASAGRRDCQGASPRRWWYSPCCTYRQKGAESGGNDLTRRKASNNTGGEIPLYPGEPCDLGHLNLPAFVRDGQVDYPALETATKLAVRFLDDVLDVEKPPLPDISDAIQDKRRIGLGVMGLADLLIRLGLRYDSEEGRKLTQDVVTFITRTALDASEALAKERGIPTGVMRAGLTRRNIAVMTVAPTGTTSMLLGVSSGIEPVYAAVYKRRVGTEVKDVAHPLLLELLEQEQALEWLGNNNTPLARPDGGWNLDLLVQALNKTHGSVLPLVERGWLPPWFSCFLTAHDVSPLDHVRMQATVQGSFDSSIGGGNSISKTINLPHQASVEAVLEAYFAAWQLDCKGITVYRDGSRGYQVLSTGEGDFEAWADELEQRTELLEFEDGTVVDSQSLEPASNLRLREEVIDAHVHKYEVGGRKVYITVGWNQAQEVVELWVHLSKPTPNEAVACDIIGRLASLAFKYGASVRDVQKHLEGHYDQSGGLAQSLGFVNSIWEVVASTLEAYKAPSVTVSAKPGPQPTASTAQCNCGGTLVREEGCWKCHSCGYSKCG